MPKSLRFLLTCALLAYAGALLVVLFHPSSDVPSGLVQRATSLGVRLGAPAQFVEEARVEFGLNVLAFVPLSFLGSLLRPAGRVSAWTALGFSGSLVVEAVQTTMPDRMATHSDIVANTLGAAVGAMLAWVALRPLAGQPTPGPTSSAFRP